MAKREFLNHPSGLWVLFFTEFWERFSYYGMRAFLVLYMVAPAVKGGLGFPTLQATQWYGWYTSLVYATCIVGGWLADRFIGQFNSVLLGGILIALGHFSLSFTDLPFFVTGLGLIVVGTGMLKPNISTLVGSLYERKDLRRDSGFSIFYMGINSGAFLGPLVAGTLAETMGWHAGFLAAGVGMLLGLVVLNLYKKTLLKGIEVTESERRRTKENRKNMVFEKLTRDEWKRLAAAGVLFAFSILFWSAFEQAGSSLTLFADRVTDRYWNGIEIPTTWYQSLNPMFIILFAPFMAWLWVKLGKKQPSSAAKFAIGLLLVGVGFLALVPVSPSVELSKGTVVDKVGPGWLVLLYFIHTIGELCLSPVGLSTTTKLAPARMVGLMMGLWFLATSLGNKLGGWIAGFFETLPLNELFLAVFATSAGAAFILFLLVKPMKRLTGES